MNIHKFKIIIQTPYVGGDFEEEFEVEEWEDCTEDDIQEEAEEMAKQIREDNFGYDLEKL